MAKNKKHKVKYLREVSVIKDVHKLGPKASIGFPQMIYHEILKDAFAIVLEKLGPSLKDIRE